MEEKCLVSCFVCGTEFNKAYGKMQPESGTAFMTYGHYGSTVFDMEPGFLEILVCDQCIKDRRKRVVHGFTSQPPATTSYEPWVYESSEA